MVAVKIPKAASDLLSDLLVHRGSPDGHPLDVPTFIVDWLVARTGSLEAADDR